MVWECVSFKQLLLRGHILYWWWKYFYCLSISSYSHAVMQQLCTDSSSLVYGGAIYSCTTFIFKSIGISHPYSGFHQCPIHFELEPKNSISSDPFQVLFNRVRQTSVSRWTAPFPFHHNWQGNGIVPGVVTAFFSNTNGNTSLAQFQSTQKWGKLHRAFYQPKNKNIDIHIHKILIIRMCRLAVGCNYSVSVQ